MTLSAQEELTAPLPSSELGAGLDAICGGGLLFAVRRDKSQADVPGIQMLQTMTVQAQGSLCPCNGGDTQSNEKPNGCRKAAT